MHTQLHLTVEMWDLKSDELASLKKKKERKTRRNGVPGNELQKDKPTNQQRVAW